MLMEPLSGHFPQRNRLIAGLSLGVLVVEAASRSGSLSTAQHAMEQNREVMAVPGPADTLHSRGCHELIRDGASLIETVDHVLEALGPLVAEVRPAPEAAPIRRPAELMLTDDDRALLGQLDGTPRGIDELIALTGLSVSDVVGRLSLLELRRVIQRVPGNQFVRL